MVKPRSISRCAAVVLLLGMCVALTACAGGPSIREHTPGVRLQWPPLPDEAKIIWVRELSDYQDAGISKGLWNRMADWIGGARNLGIVKPYGVYMDDLDRLFIVDTGRGAVHIMDTREGRFTLMGEEEGVFQTPIGITGDDSDNVYITDSTAGVIFRYRHRDHLLHPFATLSLGRPTGIAFNRLNRLLYVSDTTAHQVVVFDLNGTERLRIGGRGDKPGLFNFPTDLFR